MHYTSEYRLKIYYETVEETADDIVSPSTIDVNRTASFGTPEVTAAFTCREPSLVHVSDCTFSGVVNGFEETVASPPSLRSVHRHRYVANGTNAVLSCNEEVLCVFQSHGTVELMHLRVHPKTCLELEMIGTLCYRKWTDTSDVAMQTFVDARNGDVSEISPARPSRGESTAAHYVTGARIVSLSFCDNDSYIVVLNAKGDVGTYRVSRTLAGDIGVAVCSGGHAVDGPVGSVVGTPRAPYFVCCTSAGGNYYIGDAASCHIMHSLQLNTLANTLHLRAAPLCAAQPTDQFVYATHNASWVTVLHLCASSSACSIVSAATVTLKCNESVVSSYQGPILADASYPHASAAEANDRCTEDETQLLDMVRDLSYFNGHCDVHRSTLPLP